MVPPTVPVPVVVAVVVPLPLPLPLSSRDGIRPLARRRGDLWALGRRRHRRLGRGRVVPPLGARHGDNVEEGPPREYGGGLSTWRVGKAEKGGELSEVGAQVQNVAVLLD